MTNTEYQDRQRERRLRYALAKEGLALHKSRVKEIHAHNLGGYMVTHIGSNSVAWGPDFELDLDDVEELFTRWNGEGEE